MTAAPADTIGGARRRLAQELRRHGLDTPELDARLLLGHALGLDHAGLVSQADRTLSPSEAAAIAAVAARRRAHEPVARILGRKEFWGLAFSLTPDTLVPRPQTETVVEAALAALTPRRNAPLRIADLGTGSGALLLALLHELPNATGIGTDISRDAISCASANARALGLAARARFVVCDYGQALAGGLDLIVSNPPYIPRAEIETLEPEVRTFDPRRALDGGPDGLDGYRAIAADAARLLADAGILIVELGFGQAAAAGAVFAAHGLAPSPPQPDLEGTPRALLIRRT
ncbi:MAG: peptide chain release factor N(5)-glutamine methyltransferase [Hyphomicrobiales bacterium]|nr:peptide chain release factor N(5)-glutamine methyltransferase [Hyphomicrobiales bacterium]